MASSRTYPVTPERAFDSLLPLPLEQFFNRRFGPIPAIRGTDGPGATWGEVGHRRTVRMADGGSVQEELTSVERPAAFGYTLGKVTGPLKPLASRIEGVWSFDAVGTGTRVTWTWTMYPSSALAAPLLPIFRSLWRGYAKRALERLEPLLLA
jgi:Polyketide cyclase / dehydrase and lipid transport